MNRQFRDREAWAKWLRTHHASSSGVWLRIARASSGARSITYGEALDVALCYGWIDGQTKPESERTWLKRFVPRSKRSIWSKINRQKALALIKTGRMQPAGLDEVERARRDGRWRAAYDSQSRAVVPKDLRAALDRNSRAKRFFDTLNSKNRYAVLFRIQSAKKAETRAGRIQHFIRMLAARQKIHS
jgi:uncharacterized protein YdeI (YjbR/CyaY-like superfamily)